MLSSKVSIGDTATASQYNNGRADSLAAGYLQVDVVRPDASTPTTQETVGNSPAIGFDGASTNAMFFNVQIPQQIDTAEDWLVKIGFDMATSSASKAARLSVDYKVILDTADSTPTYTTLAETVTTPDTLDTLKVLTLSTIKIPHASLVPGATLSVKFSRLPADAADTHTGMLRLFNLHFFQTQS